MLSSLSGTIINLNHHLFLFFLDKCCLIKVSINPHALWYPFENQMFHSPYSAIQHTAEEAAVATAALITGCRCSDASFSSQLSKLAHTKQQSRILSAAAEPLQSKTNGKKSTLFQEKRHYFEICVSMCMVLIVSEL